MQRAGFDVLARRQAWIGVARLKHARFIVRGLSFFRSLSNQGSLKDARGQKKAVLHHIVVAAEAVVNVLTPLRSILAPVWT